jgi:hypothetical protein
MNVLSHCLAVPLIINTITVHSTMTQEMNDLSRINEKYEKKKERKINNMENSYLTIPLYNNFCIFIIFFYFIKTKIVIKNLIITVKCKLT